MAEKMAAQIASAEKRFCGLLHTVTAEFVDGALVRRGDPSPGRVVAAEAEPARGAERGAGAPPEAYSIKMAPPP